MTLGSGLAPLFIRYGRSVVYYIVAVCVLALVPLWTGIDTDIATALIRAGHGPALDSRVAIVDLATDQTHSSAAVVTFLTALKTAIQRRHAVPPAAVVIDIAFHADHHEDGITPEAVAEAMRGIRGVGTPVYAAVDPYVPGTTLYMTNFMDQLSGAVYGSAVTGIGHTEWFVQSGVRRPAMLWYRAAIPERRGVDVFALPLVVTGDVYERPDKQLGFAVGSRERYRGAVLTTAQVAANPALLGSRYVVVGSSAASDEAYGIAGIESVTWALNDRLTMNAANHLTLLGDRVIVILSSLFLSLLAAGTFALVFRAARAERWVMAGSALAGLTVPTTTLLAALAVCIARNVVFIQPTFEFVAVLVAVAVCWLTGREQLRYDLVFNSFADGRKKVRSHYDVFISYSRDDENARWVERNVVEPLRAARRADGRPLEIFVDKKQIRWGMAWYEEIVEALWGSRFVVAVYTARYFERPMCTEELATAMRRRVDDPAFAILPVSRVGSGIPPQFAGIQYQDAAQAPHFMDEIILAVCCAPSSGEVKSSQNPLELIHA